MKIKLIWDFKGSNELKVAVHYTKHITEFMEEKNIPFFEMGETSLSEFHQIAYVVIKKEDVIAVRDALKPHRAFILE